MHIIVFNPIPYPDINLSPYPGISVYTYIGNLEEYV